MKGHHPQRVVALCIFGEKIAMKAGLEIWKFGGASVADGRAIQRAAQQIAAHRGPLVVVVSALAGVTDLLLEATPKAADAFRRKHHQAAKAVLGSGPVLRRMLAQIDASAGEYRDVCAAIDILATSRLACKTRSWRVANNCRQPCSRPR